MLADFHFLRPLWLLALLPLIVTVIWLYRRTPGLRRWENIVDAALAPYVLMGSRSKTRRLPALAVALAGTLAITALAGPVWKQMPQPVFASQDSLVIVLDLSQSMNVADIKPSRLERARFKIADILAQREEGQTALIVYAAEAFVVSPLTDDTATIASQLSALTPEIMPSQGSRADRALNKAAALLQQAGRSRGEVLLVSDGVDVERDGRIAEQLVAEDIHVSVLAVGTADGGPIPGNGGFIKRNDGSIVIAKLDQASLQKLALRGGGFYQAVTADNRDVERLTSALQAQQPAEVSERERDADIWREEGPWLLLPLLPLVALLFRRGILVAVAIVLVLPVMPAEAAEIDGLWARPDQRASRALGNGDAATAAELFRDPAWRAAALYKAGRYEEAVAATEGLEGATNLYNRGNALARLGRYDEAIAAYEQALELAPDHDDAQFNRDLLMEQRQDEQQQSGESDQSDQSDSQDQQSQDSQSDSQNAQSDDSSDSDSQSAEPGEQDPEQQEQSASSQDEQEQAEDESEEAAAAAQQAESQEQSEEQQKMAEMQATEEPLDESEQAVEQWLRRIPDDPAGLLRRKFRYQYQQQRQPATEPEQW